MHTPPSLTLRPAEPADQADRVFLARLGNTSFARYGEYGPILAEWRRSRGVHTVLAEAQSHALGFVMYQTDCLLAVAVLPEHRAHGIGQRLVQHAVQHSPLAMSLTVACDNHSAQALFSRAGFTFTAESGTYPSGVPFLSMSHPGRAAMGAMQESA